MRKRSNENVSVLFVAVVDELDFTFLLIDCCFANDVAHSNGLILFHLILLYDNTSICNLLEFSEKLYSKSISCQFLYQIFHNKRLSQ